MLSKLRRSRSSVSDHVPELGQLTGMPALKQRRSSQRNVQLSPDFYPARSKWECKTLDEEITRKNKTSKKQMTKSTPDLLKTVPDCYSPPAISSIQQRNDVTKRNGVASSAKKIHKPFKTSPKAERPNKKSPIVKTEVKTSEVSKANKVKKHKKNISKGRGLHSVKKQRQANRECPVRDSLRALTPRERESILLLEEVLKDQSDSESESDPDDEDVFVRSSNLRSSSSSSSIVGSIIDLVGLSDSCSTYATSSTSRVWQNDVTESTYAEIGDAQPPKRDTTTRNLSVNKNETSFRINANESTEPCNAKQVEPIYSVVIKPKKKQENREALKLNKVENKKEEKLPNGCPSNINDDDNISPQRSRAFWNHINSVADAPQANGLQKSPVPTYERPQRMSAGSDEQRFCDVIDESLKAKPSYFVVTPSNSSQNHVIKSPVANGKHVVGSEAERNNISSPSSPTSSMARLSIGENAHDAYSPTDRGTPCRGKPFVVNAASRSLFL